MAATYQQIQDAIAAIPGGSGVPTGTVLMWPTTSAPTGYLLCDGSTVSRSTYADLFGVVGTTFGAGDGSTTFALPNLKGRVPVGYDSAQGEFDAMGETGGAKTHTLTSDEMPSHTHVQDSHNHNQNAHNHTQDAHNHTQDPHLHDVNEGTTDGDGTFFDKSNAADASPALQTANATATNQATTATNQATIATNLAQTATNQNTGGGQAHNNLQPYITLAFIIKT